MRDRNAPLISRDVDGLAWGRMGGLIPAIVQDRSTRAVLMVGYMDREALLATLESGLATFFSRSRQRLWQKGETSGNVLRVTAVHADCDQDALLILAIPDGPTCHLGTQSCLADAPDGPAWLAELARLVANRADAPAESSYTARLLADGLPRVAQKVGEEGVEVALAAVTRSEEETAEEIADLLYHLTVLMQARSIPWEQVIAVLRQRHAGRSSSNIADT